MLPVKMTLKCAHTSEPQRDRSNHTPIRAPEPSMYRIQNGVCLDALKKPRDFMGLTQEYSIRPTILVSFIFYILLIQEFPRN